MELDTMQVTQNEWNDLTMEYKQLKDVSKKYLSQLEELEELQNKCLSGIAHQKYRMSTIEKTVKKMAKNNWDIDEVNLMKKEMKYRRKELFELEQILPKENGVYLKIILGNVNVSICNKYHKFKYKDEYEKFKLILNIIGSFFSIVNLCVHFRPLELCNLFLLVWYYCTLTIRESILKVNGSRIKGWWRFHHFLSTAVSGILLIWPEHETWTLFRNQFMWFNLYISIHFCDIRGRLLNISQKCILGLIQYFQFRYQRGVLYRLKALGECHNMDITIEGFHSWMWRGLSFLLPLLFVGYFFQLYNAYTLYKLSGVSGATWHVPVLSCLFFILFFGNIVTTCIVIPQKIQERGKKTKWNVMGQQFRWAILNTDTEDKDD